MKMQCAGRGLVGHRRVTALLIAQHLHVRMTGISVGVLVNLADRRRPQHQAEHGDAQHEANSPMLRVAFSQVGQRGIHQNRVPDPGKPGKWESILGGGLFDRGKPTSAAISYGAGDLEKDSKANGTGRLIPIDHA